jgi:hypothetical protein
MQRGGVGFEELNLPRMMSGGMRCLEILRILTMTTIGEILKMEKS